MILALDTDVLVHWVMRGALQHAAARALLTQEVRTRGGRIGLVPQVVFEFLHVVTDARRFPNPLTMPQAIQQVRALWEAPETTSLVPAPTVMVRTAELLETFRLGRKRILDTALAATLEGAQVRRLATFNGDDYRIFAFLDIVDLSRSVP